jgi:hypothetical protein
MMGGRAVGLGSGHDGGNGAWELQLSDHVNIAIGGPGCNGLICKYDSDIVLSRW